ncbi:hypothetical protein THRCLA_22033 [Thraustotheca clavata]|uniref:Uncharacterized protein n=1 Tax=Thraustotheca clavata TaxID=74557 RepID=A0A1V9ZDE6_9STRA|nr:hypothetical protein THRCLA_22033 [Thraustotheca clavata]
MLAGVPYTFSPHPGAVIEKPGDMKQHNKTLCGSLAQYTPFNMTNTGRTPLHSVASTKYDEVVVMLLKASALSDAKNEEGWTPIHCAASNGYDSVVELLLEAGASTDIKTNV